ncbi:MAG: hypothetical protein K0R85_394 [Devosia sp.]|jgi:hypothetical protein|nr:hypothetical protein [Devosia sp.]
MRVPKALESSGRASSVAEALTPLQARRGMERVLMAQGASRSTARQRIASIARALKDPPTMGTRQEAEMPRAEVDAMQSLLNVLRS